MTPPPAAGARSREGTADTGGTAGETTAPGSASGPGVGRAAVVGVGARRGVRLDAVATALHEGLAAARVQTRDVVALVTLEARRSEPALLDLAGLLRVPLHGLPPEVLAAQPVPTPSALVQRATGTPSVAEAGVLAVGGELLGPKHVSRTVTIAIGRLPAADTPARIDLPGGLRGPAQSRLETR